MSRGVISKMAPSGALNTHCNTHRGHPCCGEMFASVLIEVADVQGLKARKRCAKTWTRLRSVHVLLHVRADGDSQVSLAMTPMRWLHGQREHDSTNLTLLCGPMCRWRAWPIDTCSNKDVGKSERKTPTPCKHTGPRQKNTSTPEARHKTEQTIDNRHQSKDNGQLTTVNR